MEIGTGDVAMEQDGLDGLEYADDALFLAKMQIQRQEEALAQDSSRPVNSTAHSSLYRLLRLFRWIN